MNRRALAIVGGLLLAGIALATWLFFHNYTITQQDKWEPAQIDTSNTQSALQDFDFLALSKTLPLAHPKSDIVFAPLWQGPKDPKTKANQLLWIRKNDNNIDDKNFATINQELLDWIAQGNQVILPLPSYAAVATAEQNEEDDKDKNQSATEQLAKLVGVSIQISDKTLVKNDLSEARCLEEKNRYEAQLKLAPRFANGKFTQDFNFDPETMMQNCRQGLSWLPIGNNQQLALYNQQTHEKKNAYLSVSADKQKNIAWQDNGPYGSQMLSMRHGKGQITFIIDMDAFMTANLPIVDNSLDKYDHLAIANYLSQNRPNILLVSRWRSTDALATTPLWKKTWDNTPWFVFLFFLTIVMIFWYHKLPKGIRYRLHPYSNRQWQQHLLAAGRFIEERKSKEALLEEWQQHLFKQWQRRYGNWHGLPLSDKMTLLEDSLKLPTDVIAMWCKPIPETLTRKEWFIYLQAYQMIRKAL